MKVLFLILVWTSDMGGDPISTNQIIFDSVVQCETAKEAAEKFYNSMSDTRALAECVDITEYQ